MILLRNESEPKEHNVNTEYNAARRENHIHIRLIFYKYSLSYQYNIEKSPFKNDIQFREGQVNPNLPEILHNPSLNNQNCIFLT